MRRLLGFFDWRFLVCLIVAVLAFGAVFAVVADAREDQVRDARLERTSAQNDRLIEQIDREHAAADRERAGFNAKFRRVLVYIRDAGWDIPLELIEGFEPRAADSDGDSDDGDDSDDSDPAAPQPEPTKKANPPSDGGGERPSSNERPGRPDGADRGHDEGSGQGGGGNGGRGKQGR